VVGDLIDHGHQQILIRTSGHVAAWPCDEARCPARLTLVRGTARLEALGQPFLFFLSSETGRGNLIYHRYDGNYGVITPAGSYPFNAALGRLTASGRASAGPEVPGAVS